METYGGLPKRIVDVAWVVLPLITMLYFVVQFTQFIRFNHFNNSIILTILTTATSAGNLGKQDKRQLPISGMIPTRG
jgi:hypothetical protein